MKGWIHRNGANLAALACYLLLNGVLICCYDPWRDVAQAWLIARDLPVGELLAQLCYEGHPCLWYLLLMPFAKLGFPYPMIGLISLALMTAAGVLLLWRAPFRWHVRCLCLFGALGIYYLPVIARSYALVPVLCCCLALAYPTRHQKPIRYALVLWMLAQVHVVLCGMVGMLMLYWVVEEAGLLERGKARLRRALPALFIMLAGVAMLGLLVPSTGQNAYVVWRKWDSAPEMLEQFGLNLFGLGEETLGFSIIRQGNWAYFAAMAPLLGLLCVGMVRWIRYEPRMALVFVAALLWQTAINTFLYDGSVQRFLLLGWQFLLCAWLTVERIKEELSRLGADEKARRPRERLCAVLGAALAALTLVSVPTLYETVGNVAGETKKITMSAEVADYIREEMPDDAVILLESEPMASAVAAYFPRGKFYNPIRENENTFATWDGMDTGWCGWGDLDGTVEVLRDQGITGDVYLLCDYAQAEAAETMASYGATSLEELKAWTGPKSIENYRLYRAVEAAR